MDADAVELVAMKIAHWLRVHPDTRELDSWAWASAIERHFAPTACKRVMEHERGECDPKACDICQVWEQVQRAALQLAGATRER